MSGRPTRIVVLGGGPAGLAAAWHLGNADPDLEITVYQQGWRLGGKGAATRGPAGRIEEHGIHLFGNFYGNALGLLRAAYRETGRSLDDELLPNNLHLTLDHASGRRYSSRVAAAEVESSARGDDNIHPELLGRKLLEAGVEALLGMTSIPDGPAGPSARANAWVRRVLTNLLTSNVASRRLASRLEAIAPVSGTPSLDAEAYRKAIRAVLPLRIIVRFTRLFMRFPSWRIRHDQADLLFTSIKGALTDEVFSRGVDSIDGQNHLDWLRSHGAHPSTLRSQAVLAIPNICFQYPDGDTTRPPDMSAAAFLTFLLRQLAAPGPNFWYFKRGTGESVVLPLYEALAHPPAGGRRPVRFEFFTRIQDVVPETGADGTSRIHHVRIRRHARPIGDVYDPIVERHGVRFWPSSPVLDRLDPADAAGIAGIDLEDWYQYLSEEPGHDETLTVGEDFDAVVLAMPPPTHRWSCPSLVTHPSSEGLVGGLEWIRTQGVQLWMSPTGEDLGLPAAPFRVGTERWSTAEWIAPNSCWVDFSDLIAEEHWAPPGPGTLVYFCGPLGMDDEAVPDPTESSNTDYPERARAAVHRDTAAMLGRIGGLLPGAGGPDGVLRYELLVSAEPNEDRTGPERLRTQYLRANVAPTELYGVSRPGSASRRPKPWQSGHSNLVLAGDWTYTGININSFEGAVTSGALASYALTGSPGKDDIIGYGFLRTGGGEDRPGPPMLERIRAND
jgi:uncharacterized protein with NAD-binding domain and iron-sulfur cluster